MCPPVMVVFWFGPVYWMSMPSPNPSTETKSARASDAIGSVPLPWLIRAGYPPLRLE